jgi:SAM-dependent methyltransferase
MELNVDESQVLEVARHWKANEYYDRAEMQDWLDAFWSEGSVFRAMFRRLDPSCLVDLACGHGRHAARIMADPGLQQPSRMILIDINSENVECCRSRFIAERRIEVLQNNGMDFAPLKQNSVSAVFCFDAMVHFEYDCVVSYIRDAFRILRPNGRALFHHSNYTSPGSVWLYNPHGRNFMSRELFAHVAMRTGFQIVNQVVMDWGDGETRFPKLDCLSLIEKPSTASVRASRPPLALRIRKALSCLRQRE